jgi:hypothetical protein
VWQQDDGQPVILPCFVGNGQQIVPSEDAGALRKIDGAAVAQGAVPDACYNPDSSCRIIFGGAEGVWRPRIGEQLLSLVG